ncbi:MAG: UDP-N-acetylglucosamine 1-carboxyvinyltransferase [Acidobacteriota bacterium]|nr:UDP-N-acetylglucosamine 1-carboxyvinyltransferase [Acidobacteriota bacterium]MDH3522575.1 UDP-N-acetylglucosamine 1-carboxyvinyltransferase [Acidobacteriota bacterium]
MDRFEIIGPNRLQGTIRAAGAKNAALPALTAALLAEGTVELSGLPAVQDIRTMVRLLEHLGAEVESSGHTLAVTSSGKPVADDADYALVKTMRASVLVLGPLVARLGHARVSLPGGCAIGVRPIDQHLAGLEALGAEVTLEHGYVTARADRLVGNRFKFAGRTVTGTENLLMAATLARGTTVLDNCAREPEVVDLARLLTAMGARIRGAGEDRIEIQGVDSLGGASHRVIADRIEGGTYLLAAAITGGDVVLEDCAPGDLAALLEVLERAGCAVDVRPTAVRVSAAGPLAAHSIETAPHPGFPTDLQAQYMALMTQAQGRSSIHETVFENRFQHAPELVRMGAAIQVDGGYAWVEGPAPLSGAHVMATDLRASACLVLAGLVAEGRTVVHRIYHLDRGYEGMEEKLRGLGARVERASE